MKGYTVLLFLVLHMAIQGQTRREEILQSRQDSIDYFMGLVMGYNLLDNEYVKDFAIMMEGMVQALERISVTDLKMSQEILESLIDSSNTMADPVLTAGQQFLVDNSQREGVVSLPSGLQYEVIRQGEGAKPDPASVVEVHYEGRLIDGTVFDSSYERGEPIQFGLRRVINGWQEGLQQMPAGSVYMLYIPPELAYGSRSTGPIPAYSTLIFKVELLRILN